jgi:tetratricopeptide (TPR) repeat protein
MNGSPAPADETLRQHWLQRIDGAHRSGGLAAAGRLALLALSEGVDDPSVLNLAASVRYGERRFEEAVDLLQRARSMAPKDAHILNSLGVCLKALGRSQDSLEAYDCAIRVDPGLAAAHFNRGSLLDQLNDLKAARASYERAAELDRNYVEPLASLAWLDARAGIPASARALAGRALALSSGSVPARLALASAELQEGNFAGASAQLSELGRQPGLTAVNRSIALGLLGDLKDAEGQPADAYAAYEASNAALKALNAPRFEGPGIESPLDHVARLIACFENSDPAQWRDAPADRPGAGDPGTHVFLVGFPRSGTTLLENVLAAHSEVVSLEERDCLEAASSDFLTSAGGLEQLAGISREEADRHRQAYWSAVRSFGIEPGGRMFIDKMPLSSVALPLIAKLFPNARILFARRDPRDVVLSCFRRRFGMNPSMYQLLTLDGAATYYDAVMRLSELYRDILPLPQHIVRYESLVEDFEGTASAACDFLGLEWQSGMREFAAKARNRGISTPSAAQVARGLNRDGQGVWRRYRDQMAPVLPILDPWVRRFGYEP